MRNLAILLTMVILGACAATPVTRSSTQAAGPTAVPKAEMKTGPTDSIVQFLHTAAATDFLAHRPPDPVRFRNVHIGHVMTPGGE